IQVDLQADFLGDRDAWIRKYDHVIFSGPIDAFFNYCHGPLEYRSLRFEDEMLPLRDFQGNAVMNFTESEIPHTRIYEHKHFDLSLKADHTLITREYPQDWKPGMIEYYPVITDINRQRY